MSSSDSDESGEEKMYCTPPNFQNEAKLAMDNLLPAKSKENYMKQYDAFMKWRQEKKANSFSENVLLAYFSQAAKIKKPSTLWAIYSMLRCTIQLKHGINIKEYRNLNSLLKRQSAGFKSNKPKIFTGENIEKFLNEAPDDRFLAMKVALVLGINGACRCLELTNITANDIEHHNNMILVKLRDTKTKKNRMFVVQNDFLNVVQRYETLRPMDTNTDRFFLNYKNGKCTRQPIGRHTIASMPKAIASFLNLPDVDSYMGHCFRRSSATFLADSGANLTTLKRHGGWRSDQVAEGYIEDSIEKKRYQCVDHYDKKIVQNEGGKRTRMTKLTLPKHHKEDNMDIIPHSPIPSTSNAQNRQSSSELKVMKLTKTNKQEAQPGPSGGSGSSRAKTSSNVADELDIDTAPKDPPDHQRYKDLDQCRLCAGFSKNCVDVTDKDRSYLIRYKTALTVNDLSVELDFNDDSSLKTVCRVCDRKLQEMYDFLKQVKEAQDLLIGVRDDVKTEIETIIVKMECESPTPDDDEVDDNDDIDSKDEIIDSITVTETEFVKPIVNLKRKRVEVRAKTQKKLQVTKDVESANSELMKVIKKEKRDELHDGDAHDAEKLPFIDSETDTKPSEFELTTSNENTDCGTLS